MRVDKLATDKEKRELDNAVKLEKLAMEESAADGHSDNTVKLAKEEGEEPRPRPPEPSCARSKAVPESLAARCNREP